MPLCLTEEIALVLTWVLVVVVASDCADPIVLVIVFRLSLSVIYFNLILILIIIIIW